MEAERRALDEIASRQPFLQNLALSLTRRSHLDQRHTFHLVECF
jgi:hypothetical protein